MLLECGFKCAGPNDFSFVEDKILKSRMVVKRIAMSMRDDVGHANLADCPLYLSAPLKGIDIEIYIRCTRKHIRRGVVHIALQDMQLSDILIAGTATGNR